MLSSDVCVKKSGAILLLVCLVILSSFVFAEVLITLDGVGGGNFTGINEDIGVVFNITVNNADVALGNNITQINVTLPSQMVFQNGTAATEVGVDYNFTVDG